MDGRGRERSNASSGSKIGRVAVTVLGLAVMAVGGIGCGESTGDEGGSRGSSFEIREDQQWVVRVGGESGTVTAGEEFDGTLEGANAHRMRFVGGEPSILCEVRFDTTAGEPGDYETWHARMTWEGTTYFTGAGARDPTGETLGTPLTVDIETYEAIEDATKWHIEGTIGGDFAHKGKGPDDRKGGLTEPLEIEAKFDVITQR